MVKKLSYDFVKNFCEKCNITLLSKEYKSNKDKLILQCSKGHIYKCDFNHIKRRHKCPNCSKYRKKSFDEIKQICENRGLIINLETYKSTQSKSTFTCKICNYTFSTTFNSISMGSGCANCKGLTKPNINKFKILCNNRNAVCLTEVYVNAKTKLKILCKNCSKIFKITPNNINNNKWCPNCVSSKSEKICKYIMEALFKREFVKQRPAWLKNPKTNYTLELDGYNSDINVAFEHQGRYHYSIVSKYKMTNNDLINIKYRDSTKKELCEKHNVKLIIIPEVFYKTKLNILKDFIIKQCYDLNINNLIDENVNIDYNHIYFL